MGGGGGEEGGGRKEERDRFSGCAGWAGMRVEDGEAPEGTIGGRGAVAADSVPALSTGVFCSSTGAAGIGALGSPGQGTAVGGAGAEGAIGAGRVGKARVAEGETTTGEAWACARKKGGVGRREDGRLGGAGGAVPRRRLHHLGLGLGKGRGTCLEPGSGGGVGREGRGGFEGEVLLVGLMCVGGEEGEVEQVYVHCSFTPGGCQELPVGGEGEVCEAGPLDVYGVEALHGLPPPHTEGVGLGGEEGEAVAVERHRADGRRLPGRRRHQLERLQVPEGDGVRGRDGEEELRGVEGE